MLRSQFDIPTWLPLMSVVFWMGILRGFRIVYIHLSLFMLPFIYIHYHLESHIGKYDDKIDSKLSPSGLITLVIRTESYSTFLLPKKQMSTIVGSLAR